MRELNFPLMKMSSQIPTSLTNLIDFFKAAEKENLLIYRDIQTTFGQSGGPIYLEDNECLFSPIGVHSGQLSDENLGTYFGTQKGLELLFDDSQKI